MTIAIPSTDERRPGFPIAPASLLLALFLLVYPFIATPFFIVQIGAQTLFLGVIALSVMLLAGYGGMVSLAQMTVAGCAGYMVAIFGMANAGPSLGWSWWLVIPISIAVATLMSTAIGAISVRTEGIYTIMITLAIAVAFFYFTRQNYALFNGFNGYAELHPPQAFGLDWRAAFPFYYLNLAVAALAYCFVLYFARSQFGLALQAIRDNPRRMSALGYNARWHRIAAYAIAGVIAGSGGILLAWFNGRVSPGTITIGPIINILVIAIVGGLRHPIGPFLGAAVFVLLQNFAIDLVDPERFNTLIGAIFLLIVLFSPDGILGLWQMLRDRLETGRQEPAARNNDR
jgi:branched-chain amino acid transport system permease protein